MIHLQGSMRQVRFKRGRGRSFVIATEGVPDMAVRPGDSLNIQLQVHLTFWALVVGLLTGKYLIGEVNIKNKS